MKNFIVVICCVLLVGCAPVRVSYDYDTTTDFSSYKTFNYYPEMHTGLSELDTNRLMDILETQLQAKGMTLSDTPDFLINIKSSEFQDNFNNSNVGVGVGGGGRNVGGGISVGIPVGQNRISRQIIFDFIDDNKSGLFWQGVSESDYNPKAQPEQREEQLRKIAVKVLEGYPPKG